MFSDDHVFACSEKMGLRPNFELFTTNDNILFIGQHLIEIKET